MPHPQFQTLRWRLLLSYLTVMLAILGTFTVAIYKFFSYSLYQQLDHRLVDLAQAAAHSLTAIKANQTAINRKAHPPIHLDDDGDLDVPWQNLLRPPQGIEWFNEKQQLLEKAGTIVPSWPLQSNLHLFHKNGTRTLMSPVYSSNSYDNPPVLEGYIRTSESTVAIDAILIQLRWGLGLGSLVALGLTGVGGLWLTRQSLKPIEQSFSQLKQFTADASHELRSPLTVIKTSVDVMQGHPERIHPQDVNKVGAIASATEQMSRLVEDLLLLARMETPEVTITQEWIAIPLDEVLEDLVEVLELQIAEKEITFKSNLISGVFVKGDGAKLTRLFANLLENALQYTPAGGIVTLSMHRTMHRSDRILVVSVEDTGIGIAPEHLNLVFHRFWRADKARSRRQDGQGMGLAIAQAIAQYHNGEITVTSQVGLGTCFRVRLPLA